MSFYDQMVDRYLSGAVPWDSELPPPEVLELVNQKKPGRALDLGCGYGRASIYLAQKGWLVDAIDFIPHAIKEASKRAIIAGVEDKIQFHTTSVADMSFLEGEYDFALDVGCMHALTLEESESYRDELCRLLVSDSPFLLFVRLANHGEKEGEGEESRYGLSDELIRDLFVERGFILEKVDYGETKVEDDSWASAWYWLKRT